VNTKRATFHNTIFTLRSSNRDFCMRFCIWSNCGCRHVPVGALEGTACCAVDGVEGAERDIL